jgi:hypothetical protein
MNGEQLSPALVEKAREHAEKMDAVAKANAVPLPGSLADAFATAPHIEVGPYRVRPFYDADFEFLQELNHPLHDMIVASQSGQTVDTSKHKRSALWELLYIFTNHIDHIDSLFLEGKAGIEKLKLAARKEFSRKQGPLIVALDTAIGQQLERYWSPCISYDSAAPSEEGEEAKGKSNFTPVTGDSPRTDSAG